MVASTGASIAAGGADVGVRPVRDTSSTHSSSSTAASGGAAASGGSAGDHLSTGTEFLLKMFTTRTNV